MKFSHYSVLLRESVDGLNIKENGIYIDGTAGGGGHSEQILKGLKSGLLISIDQDPDAISAIKHRFENCDSLIIEESNFSLMDEIINKHDINGVDGVLLDLGVSSYQLDEVDRGFSYHHEALLDMRMSKNGITAYDIVNDFDKDKLLDIIYNFGEERYARMIVDGILKNRNIKKIKTTIELSEIIKQSIPISVRRKSVHHPARKTFQAIRIAVNNEFENLIKGLNAAFSILKVGGRISVITFHSLEDRIVKRKMIEWSKGCECPVMFPICVCGKSPRAKIINRKPVLPSDEEINYNKRSRSAKLRVCEKL